MKKFKVILSVVLSIILLVCCMPFTGLVSAEETTEDTVYTIFAAAPESFDVGRDVTRKTSALPSTTTVTTAVEDGTAYYTMSKDMDIQWHSYAFADSGLDYITNGTNDYGTAWTMAWLNNQNVVTALNGLVDVSCDVRITQTTSGTPVSKVYFYIAGSRSDSHLNKSGSTWNYLYEWMSSPITSFGTWNTISATIGNINNFNMGYIAIKSDLGSKPAEGQVITVATDVRNIKLTVKESNRQAINDALASTGYDFDDLIAPYLEKEVADIGTDNVIYKANPFRAGTVGTDVSVSTKDQASRGPVEVKSDDEGVYFSYTDEYATGESPYSRRYYYNMGYDDKYEGLGWMSSNDVAEKIAGKITASIKIRINAEATSGSAPKTFPLYYGIFHKDKNAGEVHNQSILITTIRETDKWIEISNIPVTALPNFYSGYACIRVEPTVFDGALTVDIKDFKLTINSNDKEEIDTALTDTDYDFDTLIATFADSGLINPDEANAETNIIWYANPDRVSGENGGDVTADKDTTSGLTFKTENRAVRVYDEDGVYYRTTMAANGSGGDAASTILDTNIDKETNGYGWLNNIDVQQALAPYVNLSLLYRFEGTASGTPYIFFTGVNGYREMWDVSLKLNTSGNWTEVSMITPNPIFDDVDYGWYEANVAVNIWSGSGFSGTQKIDIKDMRWELRASDRVYINKALSEVEGIDSIANFTEGVELAIDENGYKDYYSLLVSPVKNAAKFDVDDDGDATILDLVRIKKHLSWITTIGSVMIKRADADANGEIDTFDLIECRKYLLHN